MKAIIVETNTTPLIPPFSPSPSSPESSLQQAYNAIIYEAAHMSTRPLGYNTCQHCILPNLTFTFTGAVIKWTFTASWSSSSTNITYPHIELWRKVSDTNYTLLQTTAGLEPVHSGLPNIYEYRLGTPWSFQEGDTLGLQLPPPDTPQLTLISILNNANLTYCLSDTFTQCSQHALLPLVTPEITHSSKRSNYPCDRSK